MRKNQVIAMILAGGQGTRLGLLTKNTAKPAVNFGGNYKIIDFPLSNCINSGIRTIGVLTQYKPKELEMHIGSGESFGIDKNNGEVAILQSKEAEYTGTADAIYKNINYIDKHNPENVLILSGDHIYKMDYAKMLEYHNAKNADATIAVMQVPNEEASRFGIMNTREDLSIYKFEEKPKEPKSNLASMGIYIFKWHKLKQYLIEDENNELSDNDFGKNIIPQMLKKEKLFAYRFNGYWKDVGTVESLWEGGVNCNFLLGDEINRASSKTQSSLLEVMEERQVTVDGVTRKVPEPFMVLATQNPIESRGTNKLPEAQMDRFLFRLSIGYPTREGEKEILNRFAGENILNKLEPVSSTEDIIRMQKEVENIKVSEEIKDLIVTIVFKTRNNTFIELGASPRGSLAILKASKALAYINDRDYVIPDDVVEISKDVLAHRIILSSNAKVKGMTEREVLKDIVDESLTTVSKVL